MKPQITKVSAWVALMMACAYGLSPSYVRADASGTGFTPVNPMGLVTAELTNMDGDVKKADPASQGRLDAFSTCTKGDRLVEGSWLQTGKTPAFAEVRWDRNNITTRVWSESVVRVSASARTVFLSKGDMLFRKNPHCTDAYTVETKRLQARIRGTTVRVKVLPDRDLIEVLEYHRFPVEVVNTLNGSRVNLTPGIVLEVRGQLSSSAPAQNTLQITENDPRLNPSKGELIFQDKNSRTLAYTANAKTALEHPLVAGFGKLPSIDSLDLIKGAMAKVPSSDNLVGNMLETVMNSAKPDKLIARNLKITSVPSRTTYYVGPNVGGDKAISLPGLAYSDMAPAGIIPNMQDLVSHIPANHLKAVAHVAQPTAIPGIPITPASGIDPLEAAPELEQTQINN
ncbi:MAG: FecR family protein [Candidatus Obscuribacterales bacterium]|nr:FecR family protein [Candidatus Obscuribacterales bacterium]